MKITTKIFYWIIIIGVGFINPIISVVLVVLYYLPKIIQDICNSEENQQTSGMKFYSEDIVDDMK